MSKHFITEKDLVAAAEYDEVDELHKSFSQLDALFKKLTKVDSSIEPWGVGKQKETGLWLVVGVGCSGCWWV